MQKPIAQWRGLKKVVVGMVHLAALPGSPKFGGSFQSVIDRAVSDAEALKAGGVHGVMIENFGDVPFYPTRVPAHVVASMTVVAERIRQRLGALPLGINVLRNDGLGALSIAAAVGAAFVHVNVLCGARVADQGILHGIAHDLLRERAALRAEHVKVFADVDVKHSAPLAVRELSDEVEDTIERGLADALIVSGSGTGKATDIQKIQTAKRSAPTTMVLVGSGVTIDSVQEQLGVADGVIVGTALKRDARVENEVDPRRVAALMQKVPT